MAESSPSVRSHPPVWLFFLLPIAGAVYPFTIVAMPFLLHREGIPIGTIGGISALALLPLTFTFAWAPLADMILSRRNWVLMGNFLGATCLYTALLLPRPKFVTLFVILLAAGNISVGVAFTALGGLMAVLLPDPVRGKASGWFQAGNIGSTAFLGGAALWLIERLPLGEAAAGIALMSFLPALSALLIVEPERSLTPNRAVFRTMYGEIGQMLRKRQTWLGFLILLCPIGEGAAYNLFSAVGADYHASPTTVLWVTGLPGGVIASIAGALLAGAINDRFPRRLTYIFCGALLACIAGAMACGPIRPLIFELGGLAYQFGIGLTWASGWALALELSGGEQTTAGTRMALFNTAFYVPLSYMAWIDGRGYHTWGPRGLTGTDACLRLGAAILVFGVIARFWPSRPGAELVAAEAQSRA